MSQTVSFLIGWAADIRASSGTSVDADSLEEAATIITNQSDEITRLRKALSAAEQRGQEARRIALEEAALWHDSKVQEYTDQIAVNDAYLARGGRLSSESRANEYCDNMRSCHRRSAAAIRALLPSEPQPEKDKSQDDADGRE